MTDAMALSDELLKLVGEAYNRGFSEGIREHTSSRGGTPWNECKKSFADKLYALRATAQPAVTTGAEPVAWLYEVAMKGKDGDYWSQHYSDTKPTGNKYQRNIRPLYAALPAANTAGDVREALITDADIAIDELNGDW